MKSASGLIFKDGEFVKGSARLENGKLILSEESDPNADVFGLILPKTVNCHTHLGDGFIRIPEKSTVEELVAPPDGLKHRMLRNVKEQEQISSMKESITLVARTGTSHFIDFRESGLEGTRRLLMASLGTGVIPVILGRPDSDDVNEISAILNVADGIGMSAISDMEYEYLVNLSVHARSTEKVFSLHASEAKREDFQKILELKPDLLVHMVHASDDDMESCASAGIPVVICPGSNAYFGLKPPLRKMLDAGITVCLGSDNAMLSEPNMLEELRKLRTMFPITEITDREMLEILFINCRKVLNSLPGLGAANSNQPDFFVLEAPVDEPFLSIMGSETENIRMFDMGGIP